MNSNDVEKYLASAPKGWIPSSPVEEYLSKGPEENSSSNEESGSIPYANVPYVPFTGGTINTAQQHQAENLLSQGAKGAAQNFLNTPEEAANVLDRKSTRLNSSHQIISYPASS